MRKRPACKALAQDTGLALPPLLRQLLASALNPLACTPNWRRRLETGAGA